MVIGVWRSRGQVKKDGRGEGFLVVDVLRLGCHCRPAVTTSLGVEVVFRGEDEEQDGNGMSHGRWRDNTQAWVSKAVTDNGDYYKQYYSFCP